MCYAIARNHVDYLIRKMQPHILQLTKRESDTCSQLSSIKRFELPTIGSHSMASSIISFWGFMMWNYMKTYRLISDSCRECVSMSPIYIYIIRLHGKSFHLGWNFSPRITGVVCIEPPRGCLRNLWQWWRARSRPVRLQLPKRWVRGWK